MFAAANAVLVIVAVVGLLADPQELGGAPSWLKPLKFAVSFVLYGIALAWMISLLRSRPRWGYWLGVVVVGAAAWLGLTLLLAWQTLRGQPVLAPDGLTLAVLAALLVGAFLGVLSALRAGRAASVPVT